MGSNMGRTLDASAGVHGSGHAARWLLRAAGFAAVLFLQLAWEHQALPASVRLFHLALVLVAVWRPAAALLIVAALGPIAGDVLRLLRGQPGDLLGLTTSVPGSVDFLEQMVLAALTGWLAPWRPAPPRTRLGGPALLVGAVAFASAATVLPARVLAAMPDASVFTIVQRLWLGWDLWPLPEWRPLIFARHAIEGVALACFAEAVVRERPNRLRQLLTTIVAAQATAVLLTVAGMARSVAGMSDWPQAVSRLVRSRLTRYTDPNATGSAFALLALAAVGLVRRRLPDAAVLVPVLLLFVGVWLTGSRAAIAAPVGVLFAWMVILAWRRPQLRRRALAAAAAVVVIAAVATVLYPSKRSAYFGFDVTGRLILHRAALRMTATAPVFGVGIGTFWDRSYEFGAWELPELGRRFGVWWPEPHEHAHNNFLQILAEQGLFGLVAFCVLLATALAPAVRRTATLSREHQWLLAGLAAFVLTWALSHPLLAPEAAFVFWIALGMFAAAAPAPAAPAGRSIFVWLALAVIVSIPVRLTQQHADLTHAGVGLSEWQRDAQGERYRESGARFSLYAPTGRTFIVPVRRDPSAPDPVRLEARLDNRVVSSVTVSATDWHYVRVPVPATDARFVRLEFVATSDPPAAPIRLQLGPDERR